MNDMERNLVIIYTAISVVLIIIHTFIVFYDNIKNIKSKETRRWILLGIILFPVICIAMFFTFVTIYGVIESIWKDDFIMVQIITNIFNFVLIYRIFIEAKQRIDNRK